MVAPLVSSLSDDEQQEFRNRLAQSEPTLGPADLGRTGPSGRVIQAFNAAKSDGRVATPAVQQRGVVELAPGVSPNQLDVTKVFESRRTGQQWVASVEAPAGWWLNNPNIVRKLNVTRSSSVVPELPATAPPPGDTDTSGPTDDDTNVTPDQPPTSVEAQLPDAAQDAANRAQQELADLTDVSLNRDTGAQDPRNTMRGRQQQSRRNLPATPSQQSQNPVTAIVGRLQALLNSLLGQ